MLLPRVPKLTTAMNSCYLDEQSFRLYCQLLLQYSDKLRDGWQWEQTQDSDEGYLKKTIMRSVVLDLNPSQDLQLSSLTLEHQKPGSSENNQHDQDIEQFYDSSVLPPDEEEDNDVEVCCVSEGSRQVLQCEYHILYSCSYQTPVLYFRASTLEGRSLSLDEVWRSIHPTYRRRLQQSPWDTITQQEHPLLGQPFFVLHPCKTEEFMKPVMQAAQEEHRQVNYVVTWLSAVGPVVGLEIPLSYSTQVSPSQLHPVPGTKPA